MLLAEPWLDEELEGLDVDSTPVSWRKSRSLYEGQRREALDHGGLPLTREKARRRERSFACRR
jgi:hypothetical protein